MDYSIRLFDYCVELALEQLEDAQDMNPTWLFFSITCDDMEQEFNSLGADAQRALADDVLDALHEIYAEEAHYRDRFNYEMSLCSAR